MKTLLAEIDWDATTKLILSAASAAGFGGWFAHWLSYRLNRQKQADDAGGEADVRAAKIEHDAVEQAVELQRELLRDYQQQIKRYRAEWEGERRVSELVGHELSKCRETQVRLISAVNFLNRRQVRLHETMARGERPDPLEPMDPIPEIELLDPDFFRRQATTDRKLIEMEDSRLQQKADSIVVPVPKKPDAR